MVLFPEGEGGSEVQKDTHNHTQDHQPIVSACLMVSTQWLTEWGIEYLLSTLQSECPSLLYGVISDELSSLL